MSPEEKQDNTTTDLKSDLERVVSCLKNPLDFEIMMYFFIYRELSLAQVEELIPHKSRATAYRHIQNLLEAGIIQESREEKVRSNIMAKIYEISPTGVTRMPHYSQEQVDKMTPKEKNKLYEIIREALYPTINFMENILGRMIDYLQLLKPFPDKELLETFDKQEFHLNLNFFTEFEFQLFLKGYQKFMQEFIPQLIEEEQKSPSAQREFVFLIGLLPIRKMLNRIVAEKAENQLANE